MQNDAPAFPLVDPREKTYFTILLVFSILAWVLIAITLVGIFYAAMFALFIWLGHGLLVAGLRAEGVEVTPAQMPELHATLLAVCSKLGVEKVPRLYIIQAGGLLNAFTTRHAQREFIVLYSDIVEAYGAGTAEMRFVLGHEIGHIQQRHILKDIFILPGRILPLLGNAYSRARENTCDRYGAYASDDVQGAVNAMMILSGGKDCGRDMVPEQFAAQYMNERGFFISWHELVSGYPTLSKRVSNLLALKGGVPASHASRNPLAYVFALFTPSGAGGAGIIIFIAVVALLAGIAVPAFLQARERAQASQSTSLLEEEGSLPSEFYGTWSGGSADPGDGSDFVSWVTTRSPDGKLTSTYTNQVDGEVENRTEEGTWSVQGDRYVEIAGENSPIAYKFEIQPDANSILFTDESGANFTETK